jgi:hypothetical protein
VHTYALLNPPLFHVLVLPTDTAYLAGHSEPEIEVKSKRYEGHRGQGGQPSTGVGLVSGVSAAVGGSSGCSRPDGYSSSNRSKLVHRQQFLMRGL